MTNLPRLRPEPIPAIHPLPEHLAEGRRKAWYEDLKQVLQVPWMGVVTMAYSHYPTFYGTLWQGFRDLCASRPFVELCHDNRAFVETEVGKLDPPPIGDRLGEIGYAPREIEKIRQIVEVFSHGNQPYVELATVTRFLLEAGDMAGTTDPEMAPPYARRHRDAPRRLHARSGKLAQQSGELALPARAARRGVRRGARGGDASPCARRDAPRRLHARSGQVAQQSGSQALRPRAARRGARRGARGGDASPRTR